MDGPTAGVVASAIIAATATLITALLKWRPAYRKCPDANLTDRVVGLERLVDVHDERHDGFARMFEDLKGDLAEVKHELSKLREEVTRALADRGPRDRGPAGT